MTTLLPDRRSEPPQFSIPVPHWLWFLLPVALVGAVAVAGIIYRLQCHESAIREIQLLGGSTLGTTERGPSWLRERLGNEWMQVFDDVTVVVLSHTCFGDTRVAALNELPRLRFLDLGDTQITDAGLVALTKPRTLTWLNLDGTDISDDGLASLNELTGLKMLSVERTRVTDTGLQRLNRLTGLERLFVHNTKVTDAGIATLKRTLPGLKVKR